MKNIKLTQGHYAIVDDGDYEYLNNLKWCYVKPGYAKRGTGKSRLSMHRLIMNFPNMDVDHVNHNGLDNRRSNLRIATRSQNKANSLPYKDRTFKGVYWNKSKWQAQISVKNKTIFLGRTSSFENAKRLYNQAAKKYYGKYAFLNEETT